MMKKGDDCGGMLMKMEPRKEIMVNGDK
jgi:hypothetical protein